MDRNQGLAMAIVYSGVVALRKESVDRNGGRLPVFLLRDVALRKESVDRNSFGLFGTDSVSWSLSARRAWIEIFYQNLPWCPP